MEKVELKPCMQGVYFLFAGDELRYIGKSISVISRIGQHAGEFYFDRAWYMPVRGNKHTLSNVERKLIRIFQPPENHNETSYKLASMQLRERFFLIYKTTDDSIEEYEKHKEQYWTSVKNVSLWAAPFYFGLAFPDLKSIESVAEYVEKECFLKEICCNLEDALEESTQGTAYGDLVIKEEFK